MADVQWTVGKRPRALDLVLLLLLAGFPGFFPPAAVATCIQYRFLLTGATLDWPFPSRWPDSTGTPSVVKARGSDPDDALALARRGMAALMNGDPEEAVTTFQRIQQQEPDSAVGY